MERFVNESIVLTLVLSRSGSGGGGVTESSIMTSSMVSPIIINKEYNLLLIDFPFSAQVAFLFLINQVQYKSKKQVEIHWRD